MDLTKKPILGMIHLSGVPDRILDRAIQEINIYQEEDVDGIIIENYHGGIRDVEDVAMKVEELRESGDIHMLVGINILPNEYALALKMAFQYQFDFIQLDHVAGIYGTGHNQVNTKLLMEYRAQFPVKILGGVWPKYYTPVAGSDLVIDIHDGMENADAIVVTGSGTGKETPLDKIKTFRSICDEHPLIIGAGLDASNVAEQLPYADGAIVGSCFKPYKRTTELVDRLLVREFMDEVKKVR